MSKELTLNSISNNGTSMSNKKRLTYLDVAKFIGIFLVAYCHIKEVGEDIPFIYSFHLALFFIISGMTLRIDENENYGSFLTRKLKSYIIPLICMDFLIILIFICFAFKEGYGNTITWKWFMDQFVLGINQKRYFSLWFVPALFISVNLCYFFFKASKGKIWIACILASIQLTFAIVFNFYTPQWLIWNIDVAMFGSFWVFIGWLFSHCKKVSDFFLSKRLISLTWAVVCLGAGLALAYLNWHFFHLHLEAWGGQFQKYYLVIPSSILSSFGIIFLSRAIDNKVVSTLGQMTLVILATQQDLSQRLWKDYILKDFYRSLGQYSPDSIQRFGYAFGGALFAILIGVALYYLIKYSPFAFAIGKKIPDFYHKFLSLFHKKDKKTKA